ncbi:MAG: hypothetical protein LW862_11165 [Rubrivivax sp.]|jgi:hypothetical protein|nr:hypothetical protein [Rubrivivax sp.]
MTWLRRISPGRSAPAGLEWRLWRRLPAITLWGLGLLGLALLWQWAQFPDAATPAQERAYWLTVYRLAGAAVLHLTLVFTVGVGCVVVMIMKGPAYEADPYPPADRPGP